MKLNRTFNQILLYGSLCIIFAAGLILRITAIQEKPLWIDEAWTLYFAQIYSYQKLLFVAPVPNDVHPGLYYAIIKVLLKSTNNIEALRIISSMLPQALVLLLFLAWGVYRKLSSLALLFVAGALSFSPFLIHYGWQLRMYSLTLLWTGIMAMVTTDFLIYRSSWSSLYILLPFIVLANATDVNGYFLAVSVWSAIFVIKIIFQNSAQRDTKQFVLWTGCLFITTLISFAPYYPFQTARSFDRASWLSPPTPLYALQAFPLTSLGLNTALFPNNDSTLAWPLVVAIGIIMAVIVLLFWFIFHIPKKFQRIYSLVIFIVLLAPAGGYFFSHTSPLAIYVPFIHRFIPPISIFLPRFFTPQALILHVLLAVCLSYCLRKGGVFIRSTAMSVVIAIVVVWIYTHQVINITSPTEKLASYKMNETIKKTDPTNSIFYPGYISLFLFHPSSMLSPKAVATIFTNSNIFEEAIKTNTGNNYCALTKQNETLTLYKLINIPSFFSIFNDYLKQFTYQFCRPISKDNNDVIVYTCRCLLKPN